MNELPLWPPFVAMGIAMVAYFYTRWESRQFDKKYPDRASPKK